MTLLLRPLEFYGVWRGFWGIMVYTEYLPIEGTSAPLNRKSGYYFYRDPDRFHDFYIKRDVLNDNPLNRKYRNYQLDTLGEYSPEYLEKNIPPKDDILPGND